MNKLPELLFVTHVGADSPADGVLQVDDVILGTGGKTFFGEDGGPAREPLHSCWPKNAG